MAALLACALAAHAQKDALEQAVETTVQTNRAAKASQDRIDALDDETRKLLERYRNALWQAQQLELYAQQLERLAAEQDKHKVSLQQQLREVAVTEREILPLMLRMLDSLEKFVALDLPFLQDERRERVESLQRLMADPDAKTAEKFARLLEAYKIEGEYANNFGAERIQIGAGNDAQLVDVLRVGRTALFYQTVDGAEVGQWDAAGKRWVQLDDQHQRGVRKALRIAREMDAADLVVLPMPAPTQVKAGAAAP